MTWYDIWYVTFSKDLRPNPLVRKLTCGFGQQNFWNQWRWSKSTASRLRWRDYGLNMLAIICETFEDIEGVWKIYIHRPYSFICVQVPKKCAIATARHLASWLRHRLTWHWFQCWAQTRPDIAPTVLRQWTITGPHNANQNKNLEMPRRNDLSLTTVQFVLWMIQYYQHLVLSIHLLIDQAAKSFDLSDFDHVEICWATWMWWCDLRLRSMEFFAMFCKVT